eukprot:GHVH01015229.1.p1 GENE.GHVH01015229.1~~GHVH01015229.1.p1  ORF type:complete len:161 (+),score=18.18 GHVH01015229.1:67-549(+)
MEAILRSAINTALGSYIHPLEGDEVLLTKENGFVLKDILVDSRKLNETLGKVADGVVKVDRCVIQELRVAYSWSKGAEVHIESLSLSLTPDVGKVFKKKFLSCFHADNDEIEARAEGSRIYDEGWSPQHPRAPKSNSVQTVHMIFGLSLRILIKLHLRQD